MKEIGLDEFEKIADSRNSIKRLILVNDISDVNFSNLGCHWTSDKSYSHRGGGQHGFSGGKLTVSVFAMRPKIFNKSATLYSREHYPQEKEVVLNANTPLRCVMSIYSKSKHYGFFEGMCNSGTRMDDWVKQFI